MSRSLTQEEIDNLVRMLKGSDKEGNGAGRDFAADLLNEKLFFLENKRTELLMTIEKEYNPNIESLKKAINILKFQNK